ncbi:hypothetical protein MA16_Dca002916 [Dendrobium catenatum]|uniref:Uncharacterized protein n=1 Tax=Dendrobium catenatum TaxID=906689 RepID=A0A2I0X915_9ASPA|nr:hypothetical protein MA16_Dca002916 [Dendrobium catenatum]
MFNILCWNCRGARKKETGNYLRHLIGQHKVCFIGLLETKMEFFCRRDIDRLAGRDWDFAFQPAVGSACGILVLWRTSVVSFHVLAQTNQCVMGKFIMANNIDWEVAVVYGGKDRYSRRLLWNDISRSHSVDCPLLVGGGGILTVFCLRRIRRGVSHFSFHLLLVKWMIFWQKMSWLIQVL